MEPEAYINKIKDINISQPLRILAENIRRLAPHALGVKLDDWAEPDDNTDLNATTTKHGLMQKYPGGGTNYLREDGSWAAPSGSGAPTSAKYIVQQSDATLSAEQAIGDLTTGILKGTTGTGVISIAVLGDFPSPTGTGFAHATAGVMDAATKLVDTADINADQVTFPKIQNISTARILGRTTGGSGDIEQLTVIPISLGGTGFGTVLDAFNALSPLTTAGDLLTFVGADNVRLEAQTSGTKQYLTQNSGGLPFWGPIANGIDAMDDVPITAGGTGQSTKAAAFDALSPTTTQGDLIFFDAVNTRLAKHTTATRYLSNTGTSNNPAWSQVLLTNGVTGTLPVANGGTGQSATTDAFDALSPLTTQGDLLYHDGTDNVRLPKGVALQFLRMNAGATAPEWVTISIATPTGTGFRHITAGVEDAAAKLVDTADINADQVTFAKIQNISTLRILGRTTAGSGDIEELTSVPITLGGTGQSNATDAFDALSPLTTQGDILFHNGTDNIRLAKNTSSTRYLSNTGASNNPQWDVVSLVNGVTGVLPVANGGTGNPTGTGFVHSTSGVIDAATKLVDTADINDDQVTFAKFQNITTGRILGRTGIGSGNIEELSTAAPLAITGGTFVLNGFVPIANGGTGQDTAISAFNALSPLNTLGDILYHDGTNNTKIAGNSTTTKLFLSQTGTGAVSAVPIWDTIGIANIVAPTGSGFVHVSSGVFDGATKLVDTIDINDDQVTFAKIQNIATDRILGREAAGSGNIEELTVNSTLILNAGSLGINTPISIATGGTGATSTIPAFDNLSPLTTEGDIIIHDGTDNIRLAKGAAFRVLMMNSAGTRPRWGRYQFSDASASQQSVGPSTTSYLTGSSFAASGIEAGIVRVTGKIRWTIVVAKTAAGTANVTMDLRVGTAGSAADASVQTYTITGASGVVDTAVIIIEAIVRDNDATGSLTSSFLLNHNLAITGFHDKATLIGRATTGSIDLTVANLVFGISVTTPASTTWNFEHVSVEAIGMY